MRQVVITDGFIVCVCVRDNTAQYPLIVDTNCPLERRSLPLALFCSGLLLLQEFAPDYFCSGLLLFRITFAPDYFCSGLLLLQITFVPDYCSGLLFTFAPDYFCPDRSTARL